MSITLNGTTGISTPDITSTTAPSLVGTNFTSLPSASLTGALPAISGSALTSLTSANLTGALPAIDGSALTGLSAGALVFISSSDLSSDATADFTGFNSALYDSYEFTLANVIPANDNVRFEMRTSSDGGVSYNSGSTDYKYSMIYQTDTASASGTYARGTFIRLAITGVGSAASEYGASGTVNVLSPHLAKYTKIVSSLTFATTSGTQDFSVGGGSRESTAAVDGVRFFFQSGNIESGTITMYGRVNS